MPQSRFQLNGIWVLAAMLLVLHFAIWKDFGSPLSQSLMLTHLGLFFIWQPLWHREQHLALRGSILFLIFTAGFIYWLSWWMLAGWLILLIGLVSGQSIENIQERRAYLLALVFLVSELLIRCVTELFEVPDFGSNVVNLFKYGLLLIPLIIALISWRHVPEKQIRPVDFFRGMTTSLLSAMLAVGSLLNMYTTGANYSVALFQSLLFLSAFLFVLSWLASPVIGFSGLAQLWERSMMNIGTPFEQWLAELAQIAEKETLPDAFVTAAMEKLVELPWIEGVRWKTDQEERRFGERTENRFDLPTETFKVRIYTRRVIGPTLRLHCKLLIQLLYHFHIAKVRELELMKQTHLQAIYETGARVTHDIKNLLQSLQTITLLMENEQKSEAKLQTNSPAQQLLQKQLPYISQRLQLALDKLREPEDITIEHMALKKWWRKLRTRNTNENIVFQTDLKSNPIIPYDLFDSVIENLLENAQFKAQMEGELTQTISLLCEENKVLLTVCDSGSAIAVDKVDRLFKQPLESDSGLGIGLYQAARQAELNGFKLTLLHNETGKVCFLLENEHLNQSRVLN